MFHCSIIVSLNVSTIQLPVLMLLYSASSDFMILYFHFAQTVLSFSAFFDSQRKLCLNFLATMHSSSAASSSHRMGGQQQEVPHGWSQQATFDNRLEAFQKIIWEESFPSIVMKDHDTPVSEVPSYGNYSSFVRRFQDLHVSNGEGLYFIYADLVQFKKDGGTFKDLRSDNPLRRKLISECSDLYLEILDKDFLLSKAMSNILRHNAKNRGVNLTHDGFADMGLLIEQDPGGRVMEALPHKWDPDFWYFMIVSNDKKRYTYKLTDHGISIAAVQGHSITGIDAHGEVPMTFNNIPSEYAVHATTHDAWERIRHEGLYPGRRLKAPFNANKRQDIHFATVLPENRMCRMGGLRENRPIWIFVENSALVRANLEPRISFNGYVLTSHNVPPRLFSCALETATSRDLQGNFRASDKILALVRPCFQDPPREEYIDNTEELRRVASAHVEPLTQPTALELMGEFFDIKRQAENETMAEQATSSSSMPSAHVETEIEVRPDLAPTVPHPDMLGGTISSAGSEQIIVDAPIAPPEEITPPEEKKPLSGPEMPLTGPELVTEEPDWDADDSDAWKWEFKCPRA